MFLFILWRTQHYLTLLAWLALHHSLNNLLHVAPTTNKKCGLNPAVALKLHRMAISSLDVI